MNNVNKSFNCFLNKLNLNNKNLIRNIEKHLYKYKLNNCKNAIEFLNICIYIQWRGKT